MIAGNRVTYALGAALLISVVLSIPAFLSLTHLDTVYQGELKQRVLRAADRTGAGFVAALHTNTLRQMRAVLSTQQQRDIIGGALYLTRSPAEAPTLFFGHREPGRLPGEPEEVLLPKGEMAARVMIEIGNDPSCAGCHRTAEEAALALVEVTVDVSALVTESAASRHSLLINYIAAGLLLYGIVLIVLFRRLPQPEVDAASSRVINDPETMQRLEKMAVISELSSAIAHEIKNPLAGISGAIQVLYESCDGEDPRKDIIGEILKQVDRLDKAVKELISFAHPSTPSMVTVPVRALVDRAVALVDPRAKKIGIALEIIDETSHDPAEGSAAMGVVVADVEQLHQVFLNIMMNALHSMPGGGTLTITLRSNVKAGVAEVKFSDTGEGIDPEYMEKIFKPFYTTKNTGTGLGLALSKNIIESHGGRIGVQSSHALGTTFMIALPLESAHA